MCIKVHVHFLVIDSKREIKGIIDTIGMRLSII